MEGVEGGRGREGREGEEGERGKGERSKGRSEEWKMEKEGQKVGKQLQSLIERGYAGTEQGCTVYSTGMGLQWYTVLRMGLQYGNEMLTLKLEDGCCTYFSNSFFRSASVLRLSMWTCMSGRRRVRRRTRERGGKEEENERGEEGRGRGGKE